MQHQLHAPLSPVVFHSPSLPLRQRKPLNLTPQFPHSSGYGVTVLHAVALIDILQRVRLTRSLALVNTALAPKQMPKGTYSNFANSADQVSRKVIEDHKVIEEELHIWARTLLGIAPLSSKRYLMSKA